MACRSGMSHEAVTGGVLTEQVEAPKLGTAAATIATASGFITTYNQQVS